MKLQAYVEVAMRFVCTDKHGITKSVNTKLLFSVRVRLLALIVQINSR